MRFLAALALVALTSCATLDKIIPVFNDSGEQVGETTVGDAAAGMVDSAAGGLSDLVSSAISVTTGNPVAGGASGLAALALLGAGASRLRRKRS